MGLSELAAQQRMQLEAVLEEFENALRSSTDGQLPNVDAFLTGFQDEAREYLEREMRALMRELVRGNYLVLGPLEAGGMGAVWKVRHLRLGKVMALKEIRPEALQIGDRQELLRRFHREIEACGRLEEHPHVVSYTDTGVSAAGVPFLVMDFIDGEDLGKIVRRMGALRLADAAQVIHDAAIGLAHAHDHGLVHRDVKPSNIMLSRHGAVKVLDFGLARITTGDHHLTALTAGKVMGTFDYMSPELCREITPDSRGDIYSLGCTFYFALAGRAPYEDAKSQFDKMDAHLHAEPASLPLLDEHPPLRATLQRMLAKKPEGRYQDLHEVAEALKPYCSGSDLRALVRLSRQAGSGSASGAAPLSQHRDGSDRATDSKASDRTAEWTRQRRRRARRMSVTAALVAAGVALLAALWIADLWRAEQHRRELARTLGTLPGLNGRWWFDEAPWLLPNVRLAMIDSLAEADDAARQELYATLAENPSAPEAYDRLERLRERFRRQWPRDVLSHLADVQKFDLENANPDEFAVSLRSTSNSLDSKDPNSLTGAEMHLRAVIHHYLEQFEAASKMYEAAAARYDREGQPALRALCLLDWGELLHGFRQPARAHSKFHLAYEDLSYKLPAGASLPPLFELYAKAMEADSHRRIDNVQEAERLLDRVAQIAATLPDGHPLRAFALERRGWLDLDLWRLEEAQESFQKALAIRRGHEPENHRARHFIYWNQQGLGMAKMYQGQAAPARAAFLALLSQIDSPQGAITARQRTELEERRPNLYERLADTALFTGNNALDGMAVDPANELESALQFARNLNFAEDGRKAVLIRLEYKAAVVQALEGDKARVAEHIAAAQALEAASASDAHAAGGGSSLPARPASYEMTKRVALAVQDWRDDDVRRKTAGRAALVGLLRTAGSGLPRDDLLLLLYLGEKLLHSAELAPDERAALARQIRQLVRMQAFPPSNPQVANSPPRVPGVFVRYLEMTETFAGQE